MTHSRRLSIWSLEVSRAFTGNSGFPHLKTDIHSVSDGAKEKMLAENENKVASGVAVADVKFTENQNGDAKLDIGEFGVF